MKAGPKARLSQSSLPSRPRSGWFCPVRASSSRKRYAAVATFTTAPG